MSSGSSRSTSPTGLSPAFDENERNSSTEMSGRSNVTVTIPSGLSIRAKSERTSSMDFLGEMCSMELMQKILSK